mgnify:CR=1 FL=1
MFDPQTHARFFGLPLGGNYPQQFVDGLIARMEGAPPHEMAKVEVYLNTSRMMRHVRAAFDARGARVLRTRHEKGPRDEYAYQETVHQPPQRRREQRAHGGRAPQRGRGVEPLQPAGGIVLGRALLEGRFALPEALAC